MLFTSHSKTRICSQVDVHVRGAAVLCALPAYLHEDDSGFLKQWDVSQYIIYFGQRVTFFCYSNPVNHFFVSLSLNITIKIVVIIEYRMDANQKTSTC